MKSVCSDWIIYENLCLKIINDYHQVCHNIDGPVVLAGGKKQWWICGSKMSYNEWRKARKPYLEEREKQEVKDLVI
jgi:hypothetical protein